MFAPRKRKLLLARADHLHGRAARFLDNKQALKSIGNISNFPPNPPPTFNFDDADVRLFHLERLGHGFANF